MLRKNKATIILVAAALLVIGGLWLYASRPVPSGKYDAFAQCLKDKGAVFYGTFWCPHCANQKAMFGTSARLLPYVECSTADGRGQLSACRGKNISGYPTWEFADGSRESGEVPLGRLAERTGCELPPS